MSTKALREFKIKDEGQGTVSAVFATLGVKDRDGDVTKAGAFEDGADVVISAYGHKSWSGHLPVGMGTIKTVGDEAVFEGEFFMDTEDGADTFRTVKRLASKGLGEWSYGYEPVKYSFGEHDGEQVRFLEQLKVFEVSPVLLGAGVGTRTLSAKSAGLRFGEHVDAVMADVEALASRAADVMAMRAEKGKSLADDSQASLVRLEAALKSLAGVLAPQAGVVADDVSAALRTEFLRFHARRLSA